MTAAAVARYVVRESVHPYAKYWYGTRWSTNQSGACVYSLAEARSLRNGFAAAAAIMGSRSNAVVRRLISRAEAVERARTKALEEARIEVHALKHLDDRLKRPASVSSPYQAALADVLNRLRNLAGMETPR